MLAKLTLGACLLCALVAAPAAAGDGPLFASQGGLGILAPVGTSPFGPTRYVPIGDYDGNGTQLLAISTKDGTVENQRDLAGQWGIPTIGYSSTDGISRDGRTLVLENVGNGRESPSSFLLLNPRTMLVRTSIDLKGYFTFDALSPDASRMYVIQYTQASYSGDLSHYIVRVYDLKTHRLLPGRIADRTQKSWVMQGSPVTRTTSADGRWVYTLYQNPGGYPFIHALDTVRSVAHCVGLPLQNQNGIWNLVLGLHGRTLSVHWRSGRPFVNVDTATWRVTPAHRGGFPWWALGFLGLLVPLGLLGRRRVVRSRRRRIDAELASLLRHEVPEAELVTSQSA